MKGQNQSILKDIIAVIAYHRDVGIATYPANSTMETFLHYAAEPHLATQARSNLADNNRAVNSQYSRIDTSIAGEGGSLTNNLQIIAGEVAICKACELAEKRVLSTAGSGAETAKLLIVGDWLTVGEDAPDANLYRFGEEEDKMLTKMLEAIRVDRQDVFITNVVKCALTSATQPQAVHVEACTSYLERQIAVLKPKVILSMGMIATRTLLGKRLPLSRLRGRLNQYVHGDKTEIPLIATYHPTYLLQNPEMKKATWVDLQLLAKQL